MHGKTNIFKKAKTSYNLNEESSYVVFLFYFNKHLIAFFSRYNTRPYLLVKPKYNLGTAVGYSRIVFVRA
jgi:hypothetical protein